MKPAKHPSTLNNNVSRVPESSYKKEPLNSPLSPKPKGKQSSKLHHKLEPMVLRSPPTGESLMRYALPIPSIKTKKLIAEDGLLMKMTKRLKMVVSTLEEAYGIHDENVEEPVVTSGHEESSLSVGDDLNSFLVYCSQFAAQLEEAAKEESHILESLFKWFQQQVNQMEEVSKDKSFSEPEFPALDKAVTLSMSQVTKDLQELEELKNHLIEGYKNSLKDMLSKSRGKENSPEEVQNYGTIWEKIEEFIKGYSSRGSVDVSITESQATTSAYNPLNAMLKIIEKQSDMLHRVRNDHNLLEMKYKQMQNDFQLLSEEKLVLENELRKLRSKETSTVHNGSPFKNRFEKKRTSSASSYLSQFRMSQDGSAFLKSSNEVSADEDVFPIFPPKFHDKSFTRVLSSKEIQDLLSARSSLPGNETVTFIPSPVVIKRKPMGSDISKADILRLKLQSKTEKQTYREEREFKGYNDISDKDFLLKYEDSETEMQVKKQSTSQAGEYGMLKHRDSILKTRTQVKKQQPKGKKSKMSSVRSGTNQKLRSKPLGCCS